MTSKTADPDQLLADRCLSILRYDGGWMDSVQLGRVLKEQSSEVYRALMKSDSIDHEKSHALTKFRAKVNA